MTKPLDRMTAMGKATEMPLIDRLIAREFGDIAHIVHLHARERPDHAALMQVIDCCRKTNGQT